VGYNNSRLKCSNNIELFFCSKWAYFQGSTWWATSIRYVYILNNVFYVQNLPKCKKSENVMRASQQAFLKLKKFARKVKEKDWVHQVYTLDSLLLQVAGK
jgi:hypothetical protein